MAASGQIQIIDHGSSGNLLKGAAEVIFAESCLDTDRIDGQWLVVMFLNIGYGRFYHGKAAILRKRFGCRAGIISA